MDERNWAAQELKRNFAKATRAGRHAERTEPRATRAVYLAKDEVLQVELRNGAAFTIPITLIPELRHASAALRSEVEVLGRGGGLHWESLDVDLSVPQLVASLFQGRALMAELGRHGGERKSAAKSAAARRNGLKGGRPRVKPRNARRLVPHNRLPNGR